ELLKNSQYSQCHFLTLKFHGVTKTLEVSFHEHQYVREPVRVDVFHVAPQRTGAEG
ncbi:mCG1047122, partial [Mus musculus]